jgi:Rrf2 family transcriptional regulator, cysteine metabolism repressor
MTRADIKERSKSFIPIGIVGIKMKLSHKAMYGILAAVDLALHNGTAPVRAKAIAHRQSIPARFLEQVLNMLKRGGLVESQRGAQGGYTLSRKPADVSLADIIEAVDGPITTPPVASDGTRPEEKRPRREPVLSDVLERLRSAELHVLSGVTLKELAERQRELDQERALMYHI